MAVVVIVVVVVVFVVVVSCCCCCCCGGGGGWWSMSHGCCSSSRHFFQNASILSIKDPDAKGLITKLLQSLFCLFQTPHQTSVVTTRCRRLCAVLAAGALVHTVQPLEVYCKKALVRVSVSVCETIRSNAGCSIGFTTRR